jgi:hypothetical protein
MIPPVPPVAIESKLAISLALETVLVVFENVGVIALLIAACDADGGACDAAKSANEIDGNAMINILLVVLFIP